MGHLPKSPPLRWLRSGGEPGHVAGRSSAKRRRHARSPAAAGADAALAATVLPEGRATGDRAQVAGDGHEVRRARREPGLYAPAHQWPPLASFDEDLDGVVVAFRGVDLLDESASIVNELPTLHCDVDAEVWPAGLVADSQPAHGRGAQFLVFRPVSGMILEGRVNKVRRGRRVLGPTMSVTLPRRHCGRCREATWACSCST